jgi:peptide/nickel transport system permease protein
LALAADPSLLIADEPTTALDANARASLLRLLAGLRDSRGLAILLVSHDWDVISALCRRAYVMYAGQIVETAAAADLRDRPRHPYTAGLLSSSPRHSLPRQRLTAIPGSVPRPRDWPAGCHFSPRCAYATSECTAGPIAMSTLEDGRSSRCLRSVGEPAATGTA